MVPNMGHRTITINHHILKHHIPELPNNSIFGSRASRSIIFLSSCLKAQATHAETSF